jgi:predicted hydrocarbon binding protein
LRPTAASGRRVPSANTFVTATLPYLETRTVAVPIGFFAALRATVDAPGSAVTVDAVRDAGYRAGQALFDAFASWLQERGDSAPESLDDMRFMSLSSAFFEQFGWGQLQFTLLSDAVVAIDSDDWAEAEGAGSGCHVSTGMFAGFFGRLANAPIAVLEVQCRAAGDARCRFLLGSVDVLGYVHEAMGRGIPYDRAAASA